MFKHNANFVIGILIVLVPFSGFPRSWRTFLLVIFGLLVALFSYMARREGRLLFAVSRRQEKNLEKNNVQAENVSQQQGQVERKETRLPRHEEVFLKKSNELPATSSAKPFFYSMKAYDYSNNPIEENEHNKEGIDSGEEAQEEEELRENPIRFNISPQPAQDVFETILETAVVFPAPIIIETSSREASSTSPRKKKPLPSSSSAASSLKKKEAKIKKTIKTTKTVAKRKPRSQAFKISQHAGHIHEE